LNDVKNGDEELKQSLPSLDNLGDIPKTYEYQQKRVTPGKGLRIPHAYLKWYDIYRSDTPPAQELRQESRAFVQSEVETGKLNIENQLGFVILHSCESVIFLIVATWQNTNELWKTVHSKSPLQKEDFALFPLGTHIPTFCVWEMAPVWHEQQAWVRYLLSTRDENAKVAYVNDSFSGLV
jgi:hypothetical protein